MESMNCVEAVPRTDTSFEVKRSRFLAELEPRLRPGGVQCDATFLARYARDVSGFVRRIAAVVCPTSTEQVVSCVEVARRHAMPLYPVSTGKNWGLGSALPVCDGGAVVDLGGMNGIRSLDVKRGYAVVEPGVTQRMLQGRLQAESAPFMINVTGAPADHSIIGNALERGVGMFEAQVDVVTVAEVVLGTGSVLHGSLANAKAACFYPPGIGPDLNGLFFQSNFGIVTAARVRLLPRPELLGHLFCSVEDDASLPVLVDRLAELRRRGVLSSGLHLGNGARAQATLRPVLLGSLKAHGWTDDLQAEQVAEMLLRRNSSAWSATTTLQGSPARVKDAARQARRMLHGCAATRLLTEPRLRLLRRVANVLDFIPAVRRQRALLDALSPLLELSAGIPSDSPLECIFPDQPADPCASKRGLLFCLPVVPFDGASVAELAQAAEGVFRANGFPLYITFNTIARDAAECVLTLIFDRTVDGEATRAQRCIDSMTGVATRLGYPPYRLSIQSMNCAARQESPFWQVIESLKEVLDPDHVIAPGRYNRV